MEQQPASHARDERIEKINDWRGNNCDDNLLIFSPPPHKYLFKISRVLI